MATDSKRNSLSSLTGGTSTPIEAGTPLGSGGPVNDELSDFDVKKLNHYSAASSRSLTNSVSEFQKEHGRTYHGYRAGSYNYPNDATEIERLDFQYELLQHLFQGKNYFAPLSDPKEILDIGTGTGQWCIEMGDEFPNAKIQGTDLSPIQPSSVPENVRFFIDDAADPDWVLPKDHFDYIHTRMLIGCFADYRDIIAKSFHHLKPGEYMESQEILPTPFCDDGTMPADWRLKEWEQYSNDAALAADRPLCIGNKLKGWYEDNGFVDVQEKIFKLPINPWPKDKRLKALGQMSEENWLSGLQGFSIAPFTRHLNWNQAEIEVYLVKVRKAIQDRNVHAYNKVYVVWGRKPEYSTPPPRSSSNPPF